MKENIMFFRKKQYDNNRRPESPSQYIDLGDTPLIAKVWSGKNRDGSLRVHWALRRRAEDGGEPFVSMRVESLFDYPSALATLASAFAKAEGVPEDLRVDCGEFANVMTRVCELLKANGSPVEKKPETGRILNLA